MRGAKESLLKVPIPGEESGISQLSGFDAIHNRESKSENSTETPHDEINDSQKEIFPSQPGRSAQDYVLSAFESLRGIVAVNGDGVIALVEVGGDSSPELFKVREGC